MTDATTAPAAAPTHQVATVGRLVTAWALDALLSFVTLGIGWLIWAAITVSNDGATPGKKMLGLKVVSKESGQALTLGRYLLLRGIVGGIIIGIPLVGQVLVFMPLWDDLNQSVNGKVSNSVVVETR